MSIDKEHLRHCLLFTYHIKKNAAEAKELICQAYGKDAVSYSTCKKWYGRFRTGNFDLNDERRSGQPRKVEDEEIEQLLEEDPYRTPSQIAEKFQVTRQAISKRLHKLGKMRKRALETNEEGGGSGKSRKCDQVEPSRNAEK